MIYTPKMLLVAMKRAGHDIRAESYIGFGCREHTEIRCLTCDTVEQVLEWEGSVLERVEAHIAADQH